MDIRRSNAGALSSSTHLTRYYAEHQSLVYFADDVVMDDEERGASSFFEPFSEFRYIYGVSGALDQILSNEHNKIKPTSASRPEEPTLMTVRSYLALPGPQRPRSASTISHSSISSAASSISDRSMLNLNSIFDGGAPLPRVSPLDAITQKYSSLVIDGGNNADSESDSIFLALHSKRQKGQKAGAGCEA